MAFGGLMKASEIIGPRWRRWTEKEIKNEYSFKIAKPEYIERFQNEGANIFDSYENFKKAIRSAKIISLTPDMKPTIKRLNLKKSFKELDKLVSGYLHKRDWARIKKGYEEGAKIPMPIILDNNGVYTIIGGNTRLNVYYLLKLKGDPKVLLVPAKV